MKHIRPLDFKIGMSVMVAVLTAAVLVLAVTDHDGKSSGGASKAQVRALTARVSALDARLAAIQQDVAKIGARKGGGTAKSDVAALAGRIDALGTELQGATRCMFQVQKEIDDLEAYLAFRTPLRRNRVTGACLKLLQPRFGDG